MAGLGKGLEAIIPGWTEIDKNKNISEIEVEKIKAGKYQPRKIFDQEKLKELAESIKMRGVIQPIIVVKSDDKDEYFLIAGERRLKASIIAGLTKIPAVIKNYNENERLEIALVENLQREDLNVIEEAETYDELIKKYHYTQDEFSKHVQKSRSYITNTLRLLQLSENIKKHIRENKISPVKARTLLSIENLDAREKIAFEIVAKDLSVIEIEKKIKHFENFKEKEYDEAMQNYLKILREKFDEKFGEKNMTLSVKATRNNQIAGGIKLKFSSIEELENLLQNLEF